MAVGMNVLVWHIHGSYLNALARVGCTLYTPVREGRPEGYGGRGRTFDLPDTVIEVPHDRVRDLDLDLVIHQTPKNLLEDGPELLGERLRGLPSIYLEHNTPKPDATNTRHPFDDPEGLVVHVTDYNRLMWDSGETPTATIRHSVAIDPGAAYTGEIAAGITVVNGPRKRPRIAGLDLFLAARERVPLAIVGMETEELGGLGDIPYRDLHREMGRHRFLYSPMRYTSLPLAVVEAMTVGMPVVALATTELPAVIEDGVTGFVSCDHDRLVGDMRRLVADPGLAREMGRNARLAARRMFGIERFRREWLAAMDRAISLKHAPAPIATGGRP